jgi:uncharacterized protein YndB with AHSA1/START domain
MPGTGSPAGRYVAPVAGVEVERSLRIEAPSRRVWELLTDHEDMPTWLPVREVVRRRPGRPDPNGVGALRVVRGSGLAIEERITAFEPERRMVYEVVAGAPVREHRGEVWLEPDGDATRVRWRVSLRPRLPGTGWLLRRIVDRLVGRGLEGLARRAERG